MAKCSSCGTTILFGGARNGEARYCNERCAQNGLLSAIAQVVPPEVIAQCTAEVHAGACPRCNRPGPVDVHTSYFVWSLVLLTSWRNTPAICCRACARSRQFGAMFGSAIVGWWGFPWGIVMTPVQLGRNFIALVNGGPDPSRPSEQLESAVRLMIAAQMRAQSAANAAAAAPAQA